MTAPFTPEALAFRNDLVLAICNGGFGKHYEAGDAFMASHIAPLLAALQQVTAERDDLMVAAGFKPGPFRDDLSREVILKDIAGMRPAMVEARRAAVRIVQGQQDHCPRRPRGARALFLGLGHGIGKGSAKRPLLVGSAHAFGLSCWSGDAGVGGSDHSVQARQPPVPLKASR